MTRDDMLSYEISPHNITPEVMTVYLCKTKASFPICTKCNIRPFSPQNFLQCLGFSCDEAVAPPAVLRLSTDLWAQGSVLVSLYQIGIRPTTATKTKADWGRSPRPLQTRRRWSSASRVKRFRRCGVKDRRLKGHCQGNPASAKCREMVEDTMRVNEEAVVH
ncbi:hypothetical protein TNCV_1297491 [Trichonephila clavipes]|nr:hypothetical protein TNCV_1297491 [Trichonephila clavipes]